MKSRFFCCLQLLCFTACSYLVAQEPIERHVSVLFTRATQEMDAALRQQTPSEQLSGLRNTLTQLQYIQQNYSGFQPGIISRRITSCQEEIQRRSVTETTPLPLPSDMEVLSEENRSLLVMLDKERQSSQNSASILANLRKISLENHRLREALKATQTDTLTDVPASEELERALGQLSKLREALTVSRTQADKTAALLQRELDNARNDLKRTSRALFDQNTQIAAMQMERNQWTEELDAEKKISRRVAREKAELEMENKRLTAVMDRQDQELQELRTIVSELDQEKTDALRKTLQNQRTALIKQALELQKNREETKLVKQAFKNQANDLDSFQLSNAKLRSKIENLHKRGGLTIRRELEQALADREKELARTAKQVKEVTAKLEAQTGINQSLLSQAKQLEVASLPNAELVWTNARLSEENNTIRTRLQLAETQLEERQKRNAELEDRHRLDEQLLAQQIEKYEEAIARQELSVTPAAGKNEAQEQQFQIFQQQAEAALRQRNYLHAITLFEQALTHAPDHPDTRLGLATAYLKDGKLDEALGHARILMTTNKKSPEQTIQCAEILDAVGKRDLAIAMMMQLGVQHPEHTETKTTLAKLMRRQRWWQAAEAQLKNAWQTNPGFEIAAEFTWLYLEHSTTDVNLINKWYSNACQYGIGHETELNDLAKALEKKKGVSP